MKLSNKLAALFAATAMTFSIPAQAIQYSATKEPMSTLTKDNYNKYWYVQLDNYQAENKAINLILNNNDYDSIEKTLAFSVIGNDIRFDKTFFTETIGSEPFSDLDITDFFIDGKNLTEHTIYALEDTSRNNDGTKNFVGYPDAYPSDGSNPELPHRLFVIDDDGNYTSYVSSSYAAKKGYINNTQGETGLEYSPPADVEEVFLFARASETMAMGRAIYYKPLKNVYVNVVPDSAGSKTLVANFHDEIEAIYDPVADGLLLAESGDLSELPNTNNPYTSAYTFAPGVSNPFDAQVYLKEFTIYPEETDELFVEFFQNFNTGLDSRMYIPLAFSVTGTSPFVSLEGNRLYEDKILLSTSTTVDKDVIDIVSKSEGKISINGNGNLGAFEFEEKQEYVFYGEFAATDDWEDDFVIDPDKSGDNGTFGGITFLLQLDDPELEFALEEGDRLWDEVSYDAIGNVIDQKAGELQEYIELTGGLRRQENYLQVEILAAEGNEMLMRIIDTTQEWDKRSYEGSIIVKNLPVQTASRRVELTPGDLNLKITEVDDLEYQKKGGDLGLFDFNDANALEEEITIAQIVDDEVIINILEEVDLVAGQDPDKIKLSFSELIGGAIDVRDEFFLRFVNAQMTEDWLDQVKFEFDHYSLNNDPDYDILYEDDKEYVLDLDALYDVCLNVGIVSGDSKEDKEESWHELLSNLEFELEIYAKAGASGYMQLIIESDNLKDGEVTLRIGSTQPSFKVTYEPAYVDVTQYGQEGGKIVITETDEEMFKDGQEILLAIEELGFDNDVLDNAEIYTDYYSGLEVKDSFKDGVLVLTIDDESDDGAGSITIEDIPYKLWAGTPRGAYNLYIGGNALAFGNPSYDDLLTESKDDEEDTYYEFTDSADITIEDFLTVATGPQVQKIVSVVDFRTGITTKNGVPVYIDSEPYITPEGWSMIGVRDLATLFEIPADKISFSHDDKNVLNVTIIKGTIGEPGSTIITMKNGSKILYVNGNPVIMGTPMAIGSDSRSYAPIRPIAEALGLTVSWDSLYQRATFSN